MFNKSFSCSILALAAAASSYGSFEMLLAVDYTNKIVRRFDGGTGAALGSFGANYMANPGAITINQSLGRAYVFDRQSRNIFSFNYNTGEYIQNWVTTCKYYTWLSTDISGYIIACGADAAGTSVMSRFSPTGSLQATYNIPAGINVYSSAQTADGSVWVISGFGANPGIYRYASTGGNFTNFYSVPGLTVQGGDARAVGNVVYFSSTSLSRITSFNSADPATITSVDISPKTTYLLGIAGGHGSTLYLAGADVSTGNASVFRYNTATQFNDPINTSVPSAQYASLAVVAAPEPGTWLALCGGLALCGFRRRRQ